jgi:hypothetical protein
MLKKRDAGETAAKPYGILSGTQPYLESFQAPSGTFDSAGAWTHSYRLHLAGRKQGAAGFLEIRHEPAAGGAVLHVETHILHDNGGQQTRATVQCRADRLCTPQSWQLESLMSDAAGQPIANTRVTQRATIGNSGIAIDSNGRKRVLKVSGPLATNWGLFCAVQRLAAKDAQRFTLLEEMDLIKPNQQLSAGESITFHDLRLTSYEQTGDGVLPFHYWLDDQHRVLFVLSGQRAYIYDAEARNHLNQGKKGRKQ